MIPPATCILCTHVFLTSEQKKKKNGGGNDVPDRCVYQLHLLGLLVLNGYIQVEWKLQNTGVT